MRCAVRFACLAVLLLPGCRFLSAGPSAEIDTLEEAKARWASFGFTSYAVDQTRTCECLPPYAYTAVVTEGEVDSLIYDTLENAYGKDRGRLYDLALENAWTVDEAFDVIERERAGAAEFRVTYHPRYGYPTNIYINPEPQVVDEEIIRTMSNLKVREKR